MLVILLSDGQVVSLCVTLLVIFNTRSLRGQESKLIGPCVSAIISHFRTKTEH